MYIRARVSLFGTMRCHVERELARAATTLISSSDAATTIGRIYAVLCRTPDGWRLNWTMAALPNLQVVIAAADLVEELGALAESLVNTVHRPTAGY